MGVFFHDDFSDGIWTKYPGNPVVRRDQPWAESHYLCEPNLLHGDGLFRMWFSQMFPANGKTAVGYATSPDGLTWTKHPGNPVLASDHCEIHRPYVICHAGRYYLFAMDDEQGKKGPATMRRWSSTDGIVWDDERLIMTADQAWERGGLSNMSVIVDDAGRWHMLYTSDCGDLGKFGYAGSDNGLNWTKYGGNPVIRDLYGGDPYLVKIGEWYAAWHSEAMEGSLRIVCRRSRDMIHWDRTSGHVDVNYTQVWERGVAPEDGGSVDSWYGHLTDASICEMGGRVFLMYQGAQSPLGIATFDGTLADLAARWENPPLARWEPSPYGMVEGGTLKLADNGSDSNPLVARIDGVSDCYTLSARFRCYGGPTHRISLVLRYADTRTFARVWAHDSGTIYYQECLEGLVSLPWSIGPAPIIDAGWHEWTVRSEGRAVVLTVDGQLVGQTQSSAKLMRILARHPLHVGFSTHDAWAEVDWIRVEG